MNFKQLSSYFTFLFVVSSLKSRLYMTFTHHLIPVYHSQRRLCRYDQSILKSSLRHLVSNVKQFFSESKTSQSPTVLFNIYLVHHITTKKKLLGLHHDEEITFKYHGNEQINTANKKVGIIIKNLMGNRIIRAVVMS